MTDCIVTLDGPAGSGKSTLARLLADKIGAAYLDTGAMYRAVTLAAIERDLDLACTESLLEMIQKTNFSFNPTKTDTQVLIDGIDCTEAIRKPAITSNVKFIAANPAIRNALVQMQQDFASKCKRIVTEGRDQGTVVFPKADHKFFINADVQERAKRRQLQLDEKGIRIPIQQLMEDIQKRDESDSNRKTGPLKPAKDAITINTTDLGVGDVLDMLLRYVEE